MSRPSKTKILTWKFFPITYSATYNPKKAKKSFYKCHWESWTFWGSSVIGFSLVSFSDGVLFSILHDRVFFRVFSGRVLFRFLSDRSFSRVLCPLFSVPRYCFIKKRASTFLIKNMLYFGALIVSTAYITRCHSSLLVTRSH